LNGSSAVVQGGDELSDWALSRYTYSNVTHEHYDLYRRSSRGWSSYNLTHVMRHRRRSFADGRDPTRPRLILDIGLLGHTKPLFGANNILNPSQSFYCLWEADRRNSENRDML